jgi:hypothetical protein
LTGLLNGVVYAYVKLKKVPDINKKAMEFTKVSLLMNAFFFINVGFLWLFSVLDALLQLLVLVLYNILGMVARPMMHKLIPDNSRKATAYFVYIDFGTQM